MERKVGSSTVTAQVQEALGKVRTLSAEEEKVVRMRHGTGAADMRAPLPRAAGANEELADELLLLEMQLLKGMRARTGQTRTASRTKAAEAAARVGGAATNRTKEKIVRALRSKKR
jgi:hypothetical protein